MSDASTRSLALFDNHRHWDLISTDVPIFVPHRCYKRTKPDGSIEYAVVGPDEEPDGKYWTFAYAVDEKDLREIAKNINHELEENGNPIKIFEGHTKPPMKVGQNEQPKLLGYGVGAKFGLWGPKNKPGVLLKKQYIRKGCKEAAEELPERSAEYHPGNKEIRSLALIKTDPRLPMGMTIYQCPDGVVCYARGVDTMPDPAAMPGRPQPTLPPQHGQPQQPPPGNDHDEDDITKEPDFEQNKKQFMSYMKHCYPKVHEMHNGQGGMAMPSGTNGSMPGGPPKKEEERVDHAHTNQGTSMEAFNADVLKIQMQRMEEKQKYMSDKMAQDDCQRRVKKLALDGYLIADPVGEVTMMMGMDDNGRERHEAYIKANFQKDPTHGPMIETERGSVDYGQPNMSGEDVNAVVNYCEENDLDVNSDEDWRKAEEMVKRGRLRRRTA